MFSRPERKNGTSNQRKMQSGAISNQQKINKQCSSPCAPKEKFECVCDENLQVEAGRSVMRSWSDRERRWVCGGDFAYTAVVVLLLEDDAGR
jgi:hypothetical protein